VEAELPALGPYFDARLIQTDKIAGLKRGTIKGGRDVHYAVSTAELWPDLENVKGKLLQEGKKTSPDADIKVELLDIPVVHCYQEKDSVRFFLALAETSQIDLFAHRSV
jgi:hypothetical protein